MHSSTRTNVAPTASGRPRVADLERLALAAEGVDQNDYATAGDRRYVLGVRDAVAWALGWAEEPPALPSFVAGHVAQDVEEAVEGVRPDDDEERL
jgi:hypothetical protein